MDPLMKMGQGRFNIDGPTSSRQVLSAVGTFHAPV
jgi:hypothetical protein